MQVGAGHSYPSMGSLPLSPAPQRVTTRGTWTRAEPGLCVLVLRCPVLRLHACCSVRVLVLCMRCGRVCALGPTVYRVLSTYHQG